MKRAIVILGVALAMLVMIVPTASAAGPRFGVGFYGGGYWGPGPYAYGYGPYAYGPYWGYGYAAYPASGTVKLDTPVKNASVFINGAYAGTTHDDKTMHLRPGTYNVEIREGERTMFSDRIYVTAGKTLHLHPTL